LSAALRVVEFRDAEKTTVDEETSVYGRPARPGFARTAMLAKFACSEFSFTKFFREEEHSAEKDLRARDFK
jgi:hypothetical protein